MDLDTLFDSPDQFLHAFQPPYAMFVNMDRAAYQRSIFCDMRISPISKGALRVSTDDLLAAPALNNAPVDVCYIFHIAHCGSTLLARALDLPDQNIVTREPLILRQLAVTASNGEKSEAWSKQLALSSALLSRRYIADGPAIVKANVPVNFIIPELLTLNPKQKSILLYFGLEHYLFAILRSPNHRKWVHSVVHEMRGAISKFTPVDETMTDAQKAAALWFAQISIYANILSTNDCAVSLNAETLFNDPLNTIGNAFTHFGQPQEDKTAQEIIESDLFAKYSKNPKVKFDNDARLERRNNLRKELAPELDQAQDWVRKAMETNALPERLPNALTGQSPALLECV